MKKISILFILSLLFISAAFSHPFIPVVTDSESPKIYKHISDDCQYQYKAFIFHNRPSTWHLRIVKKSLVSNSSISLRFIFRSEADTNDFTNKITSLNLEPFFNKELSRLQKMGIKPSNISDKNGDIVQSEYTDIRL